MSSENRCNFIVLKYKILQAITTMLIEDKVTELFYIADDFCKFFDAMMEKYLYRAMQHLFPKIVSYNCFVELEKRLPSLWLCSSRTILLGKCTGISFVDSTPLRVCRNQRIGIHKVFKGEKSIFQHRLLYFSITCCRFAYNY